MASIKELQALYLKHQVAEAANVLKAAEAAKAKLVQDTIDLSDLLIQAIAHEPFVRFPEDMFKAVYKTALGIFEAHGIKVNKDMLNNNLRDLTVVLEALDPRMDGSIQKMAIAKLAAPAKPKEVGMPRFQDRPRKQDKKKDRQKWDENTVAKAMAKAKADAEAKAKDNPAGLPAGAVDLTATVE